MTFATPQIPTLETERLVLRAPRMGDADAWDAFLKSDRAAFVGGGAGASLHISWRSFAHAAGQWMLRGYGSFIFATKDAPDFPLGMTGPWFPLDWPEQELGWTLWSEAAEGQGFAFEAATRARDFAYVDLGWKTAVSYIDAANYRSIALAERLGCTLDKSADTPQEYDIPPLVYRHPAQGAAA